MDDEDEVDPATHKPVKHKFEYTTKLVEPPEVLCVQLSRFSFDYSRGELCLLRSFMYLDYRRRGCISRV